MGFLKDLGNSLLGGIPSMIGNAVGAISNNSTNKANKEINQMNNEFNERMMDKQIAYEKEMWEKNNEYNSASAQAERWREAGFNPTMMMGNANAGVATSGSVGAASAAPAAPQQAFKPDVSSFVDTIVAMQDLQIKDKVTDAQVQQLNSQSEVNKAEVLRLLGESDNWKIKNKYVDRLLSTEIDSMNADIGYKRAQESYTNTLENYQLLMNERVPAEMAARISLMLMQSKYYQYTGQGKINRIYDDVQKMFGDKIPKDVQKGVLSALELIFM